jgi:hypothetical protein
VEDRRHAWSRPVNLLIGLGVAALGIGAAFVTGFTSSLADADPTEGGLRSAIVNTFHEIGGAVGVEALSSIAGVGMPPQPQTRTGSARHSGPAPSAHSLERSSPCRWSRGAQVRRWAGARALAAR